MRSPPASWARAVARPTALHALGHCGGHLAQSAARFSFRAASERRRARRRTPAQDEQRASRGAVGSRLLGGKVPRWPPGRRSLLTGGAHASVDTPRVRVASSRPQYTSSGFIGSSRTRPGAGTSTSSRSMGCDSRSSGRRSRRVGGRDRRCLHARPSPAARREARGLRELEHEHEIAAERSPLDPTHNVLPFSTDDLATS